MLTFGSLFSGAGLMDHGLDVAGWSCRWMCEIDPHARRVLAARFPGVEVYPDVTALDPSNLATVDLLVGGSPCQDIIVAGRGDGLAGDKSRLFFDFVRVADVLAPRWVLWENVANVLSVNGGEDFAVVLEQFTGFRPAVPDGGWRNSGVCWGSKRGCAWRLLDAQSVGGCPLHVDERGIGPVPQRRRRVFLVADSGDGRGLDQSPSRRNLSAMARVPVAVLFESESSERDFGKGGAAGARAAATLRSRSARPGGNATGRGGEDDSNLVTGALQAHSKRHGHAMGTQQAAESGQLIAATFSELGEAHATYQETDTAMSLRTSEGGGATKANLIAYQANGSGSFRAGHLSLSASDDNGSNQVIVGDVTHSLRSEGADASEDGTGRGTPLVAFYSTGATRGVGENYDLSPPLKVGTGLDIASAPAIAFQCHGSNVGPMGTLRQGNGNEHGGVPFIGFNVQAEYAEGKGPHARTDDVTKCLDSHGLNPDCQQGGTVVSRGMTVRRLTPTECLRLMGMPDSWLDIDPPLSDSAKYRLVGNGVVRQCSEWIGRRLAAL